MPTNDTEAFKNEISTIENIIKEYKNNARILMIGDFNACPERIKLDTYKNLSKISRIKNNIKYIRYPNDTIFIKFLSKHKLELTSKQFTQYTYNTFLLDNRQSNIDYVILYESTQWQELISIDVVCECCCGPTCWDLLNTSDHRAIKVELNVNMDKVSHLTEETNKKNDNAMYVNWKIEWMVNRYQMLFEKYASLSELNTTISKLKKEPSNQTAQALIDHYNSCVLISKSKVIIKRTHNQTNGNYNNYNLEVRNAIRNKNLNKDKTDLKTKELNSYYRREQRRLIRKQTSEQAYKRIERINSKFNAPNRNEFWKEIKNQTKTKKEEVKINVKDLEKHYKDVMNKPEGEAKVNNAELITKINRYYDDIKDKNGNIEIGEEQINRYITNLKNNKAPGFTKIENEAYKYAPRDPTILMLKTLLETIINYRLAPELINVGVLSPIIKDVKSSPSDINNLRPITLSEPIAIILESYLMEEMQTNITINKLQFGFRKAYSTQHAIYVLKETILQHQLEKKPLYLCFLDFSKAFDKINKYLLIYKLMNMIGIFLLFFLTTYIMLAKIQIKNGTARSSIFEVMRGVKQGGPASPFLFALYVNEMIDQVIENGRIVDTYGIRSGIICYADDTTVASKNIKDLTSSTNVISNYCVNNEIKLNESKTKWMQIGGKNSALECLKINDVDIEKVSRFKFLGFELTSNMSYYEHITTRINKSRNMIYAMNKLGFGTLNLTPNIKTFMYGVYARSVLTYGFENIYFNKKILNEIRTYESTIIKRALYLPKHSSVTKIFNALNITPIDVVIKKRKLNFLVRISENNITREIAEAQSIMINNLHKQSLLREIYENYISKPIPEINTLAELLGAVQNELISIKNKWIRTDESDCINHLLKNRTRSNNKTLYNLICNYEVG